MDSTNPTLSDTIFEIFKSNDDRFVAARRKYKFSVFYLQDEFAQQDFQCERNIPFISGTFVDSKFFSIDANRVIQRHDLITNQECGKMYLKLPKNNSFWCQLKQYKHQLVFADTHKLKLYDSRLFGRKASKCMEMNLDSVTEKCEEIICIRPDDSEYNVYVATTHNLFVFDVRYGSESTNQLTRYTHQLKTPPLMIDAAGGGVAGSTANKRLIALAGSLGDDIAILQHTKTQNDKLRTNSIPQKVLNTSDVCRKLCENGLQAQSDGLQTPNRLVNVGTKFTRLNDQLFLLSEKASGEIWYQQITHEENQTDQNADDKPLRNINQFSGDRKDEAQIKATTVTNFNSMKKILKFTLENQSKVPDTTNPQPNKWQKSMQQLGLYKDMLSADLLNVWQEVVQEEKINKGVFVSGWVNQSTTETMDDEYEHHDHI